MASVNITNIARHPVPLPLGFRNRTSNPRLQHNRGCFGSLRVLHALEEWKYRVA
jgi:hypothetical protein